MIKISMIAALALSLLSTQVYAQKIIKLNPRQSKSLKNTTIWTFNATCDIQADSAKEVVLVSVKENKGIVNGKTLSKGQSTSVSVKNNDQISVSAEPGTVVNLVNMGKGSIEANCSI